MHTILVASAHYWQFKFTRFTNPTQVPYSTMHHFVTKMCTCAHFCCKMVQCGLYVWWDLWNGTIVNVPHVLLLLLWLCVQSLQYTCYMQSLQYTCYMQHCTWCMQSLQYIHDRYNIVLYSTGQYNRTQIWSFMTWTILVLRLPQLMVTYSIPEDRGDCQCFL